MRDWRAPAAIAGVLLLQACAGAPAHRPSPAAPPRPWEYRGCRTRACVGGDPRRRQYFDQRRRRYYWFDPGRKRYFWEDGSPFP